MDPEASNVQARRETGGVGDIEGWVLQANTSFRVSFDEAIGNEGLGRIVACLRSNNISLQELRLFSSGITAGPELEMLAAWLATNLALTLLDIGQNAIGNSGLRALLAGLLTNTTLTTLNLVSTGITAGPELEMLAAWLASNPVLTELVLGWNGIGNRGLEILVTGLRTNTTLDSLGLCGTDITDGPELEMLAALLATNSTLTDLW